MQRLKKLFRLIKIWFKNERFINSGVFREKNYEDALQTTAYSDPAHRKRVEFLQKSVYLITAQQQFGPDNDQELLSLVTTIH